MNSLKFFAFFVGLALSWSSAGMAGASEAYFNLERMPVVFNATQADQRLMLVEITLVVADGRETELRRRSHVVKAAILQALQEQPFAHYRDDNAAEVVKTVARRAARRAVADIPITDALIRSLQLR